ncbi:DMT family transporter [Kocuria tytonis]|uniref:QacE family quaternary ammonium compound efflux SMR transporter n=1 Tax=Kocuria tytonis TaxID=2054280 RepID=A0A495A661_9MICC|nr:SMR family transporter [Kocuria tytonis]RKQ35301.1 QacE family quaternary ammonium compound efflux SMR transporter [Kocuria tytonis]
MTAVSYVLLAVAIVCEVGGTVALRMVSAGSRLWWFGVAAGYLVAFTLLGVVLAQGMALGVAYGIWAATGVALTALISRVFFKEPLTWVMALGLALIVGGVLLIETGA